VQGNDGPAGAGDLSAALARAEAARDAGQLAAGLAAAEQAWRLAADAPAPLRLRAGRLLLHFRYRSGALWALVDAGLEVLPLMRDDPTLPAAELIDTLRMVTLSAADVGRFEDAMAAGREAHALALDASDRARLSLCVNAMGCLYERIGDPWHAERLLLDALALGRDCGDRHAIFVALNNLTAVLIGAYYLLEGDADGAERQAVLERALPHAEEAMATAQAMPDRFYLAFVQGNRGEALAHLGRLAEARADLTASMQLCREGGFDAQAWRVAVSWGELLLREGDAAGAWAHVQQALQASAAAEARNTQLRLHHTAWRAARALGRIDDALHHLEQYERREHARMLSQLRGRSQLFVTAIEAEQVRRQAAHADERAARAEVSARIDQLTGLGNRRELDLRWGPLAQRVQAQGQPLALAMLDLDHFKQVNDRFGHDVGDAVLVALARLLRENTRGDDLVIRTGGEEFLLVLPDADPGRALEVCERLRQRVAAHDWQSLADGLRVTVSVGLAAAPPYDRRALVGRADTALYAAKRGGRNRVQTA
jgi:diguanylate cyclase (GGDEF)-like protein